MPLHLPQAPLAQHLERLEAPVRTWLAAAHAAARGRLVVGDALDATLAQHRQRELHGLAWIATTGEAVLAAARWGLRLAHAGRLAEPEALVLRIGIGEYLAQLTGGIAMSQNEIFRPHELGLGTAVQALASDPTVAAFL
ncbi:MAG: acyl-CoA dehydrogenase, partial [Rhodoferax sp.]|nr:acyl-CoA dehydrogenase [Rhodoferax sp.]